MAVCYKDGIVRRRGSRFLVALSVAALAGAGVVVWECYRFIDNEFPDVAALKTRYAVVEYHGKGPKAEPPTVKLTKLRPSSWVGVGDISKAAVGAVLVSEDWAFYQHKGYDANQIKEAIKEDIEEGRFARGASTITQQVVRNVFLDKDKNLWRKVKEFFLAIRLERSVGKRKILETYLNIAEWGEGIFGIGPAARHYFGKSPAELTAREGAFLAMLLPSPKRYSQSFRAKKLTKYARGTVDSILGKMNQAHYLTDEERTTEIGARLSFEAAGDGPGIQDAAAGAPNGAPSSEPLQPEPAEADERDERDNEGLSL